MPDGQPSSPASPARRDDSALLSTHVIPHSASEPSKLSSTLSGNSNSSDGAAHNFAKQDGSLQQPTPASPIQSDLAETTSPPPLSESEQQAFSSLFPNGSSNDREVAAYTAAAPARGRNLDQHGELQDEFDPNRRTSVPTPATVLKNLPGAATKTLTATTAAPARTLDSIRNKLQSPSTGTKSKSEIPHSLSKLEHDLRHNAHAPGNLDADASSQKELVGGKPPSKSSSFSSLFRGKSKKSERASALMKRGRERSSSGSTRSNSIFPPHGATAHTQDRPATAIQEDGELGNRTPVEEEEEEEDDDVVQQRIYDQQKRLEELDEAQTVGLLRTQQEAGIEPIQSPEEPTKPSWLVGLPLFGNGTGSAKDKHGDGGQDEGQASRRSSFRRSSIHRRGRDAGEGQDDDVTSSNGLRRGRSATAARSASASRAPRSKSRPKALLDRRHSTGLHPPRRNSTTWTSKLRTKIPIKEFPLQGSGRESEFNQECPLWARQPYKYMYFSYFGLSVGLYYLPRWAISSILPSHRGRPDWSWKKATMVKLFRHGTKLTFRTRTSLGRDLQKEVPHSKTVRCKFTWVKPVGDEDVRGELSRAMEIQKVMPQRTCGFWYGEVGKPAKQAKRNAKLKNDAPAAHDHTPSQEGLQNALRASSGTSLGAGSQNSDTGSGWEVKGGVGRSAEPGEKVLYHLHGGAYWIGTAHEKDVTAAVNTESLRYMAEIYKSREAAQQSADGSASSSSSSNSAYSGKLLRSFSLDYRLCVPGRPRAGSYPAALLDALSGYLYLVRDLNFAPENIIIAGDSAGGNLALALCRYLRDEGPSIAAQPGALLLMSPWVDVSRSHSGPTGAPNLDSTVFLNQDSDIISSMIAFRNTAVSAFLGNLPARETYRNPYMSPVSLQLPLERGGKAPHWGFHGFPKKIYITTGSAEISYDQHLTLAHRLAGGTRKGRPVYSGDKLSAGCNAREMAERRGRPRPKELLDAEQAGMGVTPMEELQGWELGAQEGEGYVTKVVDGEPREGKRPELESRDTTLLGENRGGDGDAGANSQDGPSKAAAGKRRLHAAPPPEPTEKEDRQVILDEVKDAVHDYLLFKWFEPERSSTWRRIAEWIDDV
ncbi:potential esterase/lipase [Pseudozyma hubeiensis SY62]|uniref:Potential esterase/lipase n=1 Tax=Pseudozyma hubeiensis (strain SY62) TaxID=1305764 RepID=R9PCG0_PSEHS|nr:potential esterase/lipase [Pseudozyma hubeiensis SY62]GAC99044.1 potential esterase/lipase [Pseudozyma hubeiensis SY62]